jgi:outer membrane lipoprotein-sorting protein
LAEKKIFRVLPLFFLLFLTCIPNDVLGAPQEDLRLFLRKIQKSSDKARSFSAEFTQEKILTLFSRPVHFKGKLYIVRPDRLRWEFISPVPSALIFRGEEGLKCRDGADPTRFNLSEDVVMKMVAGQLWLWLGGDYMKMAELFSLEKTAVSTLKVTPVDEKIAGFISSVTIMFDQKTFQPLKVEIAETGGDLTRIFFHSIIINEELSEKLFSQCPGSPGAP